MRLIRFRAMGVHDNEMPQTTQCDTLDESHDQFTQAGYSDERFPSMSLLTCLLEEAIEPLSYSACVDQ